jgi:hypothetical protein
MMTDRPTNQPTNQPASQPTERPTNQPTDIAYYSLQQDFGLLFLSYFVLLPDILGTVRVS